MWPIKNFEKYFIAHQYLPKIFHDPHKNPPGPFFYIFNVWSFFEKWKQIIDNKGYGAAILMDLSRVFDTTNHELLIAKLHAYDFTRESPLITLSYISDRCQHELIFLPALGQN